MQCGQNDSVYISQVRIEKETASKHTVHADFPVSGSQVKNSVQILQTSHLVMIRIPKFHGSLKVILRTVGLGMCKLGM